MRSADVAWSVGVEGMERAASNPSPWWVVWRLHRAALAACSQVSGVKVAQSLIVGFAGATFWICFELFGQLIFRFQKWRCMYFW